MSGTLANLFALNTEQLQNILNGYNIQGPESMFTLIYFLYQHQWFDETDQDKLKTIVEDSDKSTIYRKQLYNYGQHIDDIQSLAVQLQNVSINDNIEDIKQKYELIEQQVSKSNADLPELQSLFRLIDRYFFNNDIHSLLKDKRLILQYSNKMTKTGGNLKHTKNSNHYTITISSIVNTQPFHVSKSNNPSFKKGDYLQVNNSTQSITYTLAHELVHLYLCLSNKPSGHTAEFKDIALNKLGQSEIKHSMLSGEIDIQIPKDDLYIGKTVSFQNNSGVWITDQIIRINPTSVTIKNNNTKYRIPYSLLREFPS